MKVKALLKGENTPYSSRALLQALVIKAVLEGFSARFTCSGLAVGWPKSHASDHKRSLRAMATGLDPTEQDRRWQTLPRPDDMGQKVEG